MDQTNQPESKSRRPAWALETAPRCSYTMSIVDEDLVCVEHIEDLTREEYIELKRYLAELRGFRLAKGARC